MRLHLGSGSIERTENTINLDIQNHENVDVVSDIRDPLPFDNDMFEECFSFHVIEHIHKHIVPSVLQEIYRVLKPEGRISMLLPDCLRASIYISRFYKKGCLDEIIKLHYYGRPEEPHQSHLWGWFGEDLMQLVKDVGFYNVGINREGPEDIGSMVHEEQDMYAMTVSGMKPPDLQDENKALKRQIEELLAQKKDPSE